MKSKFLRFIGFVTICTSILCGCESGNGNENHEVQLSEIEVVANDDDENVGPQEEIEETALEEEENYIDMNKTHCMVEPILQNPTKDSVTVVWFTDFECADNSLFLYEDSGVEVATREIEATTTLMSRLRGGTTEDTCNDPHIETKIYRHQVIVDGLPEYHGNLSERVRYKVHSREEYSNIYTLSAMPCNGTPMKILMTSDLQIKDMCAANIEKAYETEGKFDAVWVDGDIVDVIDRVYDWFYADNAFYRVMTGTAQDDINGTIYKGAPILQETPIFTAIGNHDVMGVYDNTRDLSVQFNYPSTRKHAEDLWEIADVKTDDRDQFILDNSYNTITYEEMFSLPESIKGEKKYYAVTIGDIRLITLDLSRVWRQPALGAVGKYTEIPGSNWFSDYYGFGDFIFEPISEGSKQLEFLKEELSSQEYIDAKYKVVMFHMEAHSLGGNQIPPFTDPIETPVIDPVTGIPMMTYDYSIDKDYINTIVEPLLEKNKTDLLFNAHSHLWNRFVTKQGMNVVETSNVGNSYGAFDGDDTRIKFPSALIEGDTYESIADVWKKENYCLEGDPYGLQPVMPTEHELPNNKPYLDSNTITAFTVMDTNEGVVKSYYYDTVNTDNGVILFDKFDIKRK